MVYIPYCLAKFQVAHRLGYLNTGGKYFHRSMWQFAIFDHFSCSHTDRLSPR